MRFIATIEVELEEESLLEATQVGGEQCSLINDNAQTVCCKLMGIREDREESPPAPFAKLQIREMQRELRGS